MGLHSSGSNIILDTQTFTDGNDMVEWLHGELCPPVPSAGWTEVGKLTSEITFSAFSIVNGVQTILDGNGYQFYDPMIGGGNVPIGVDLQTTLNTYGAVVKGIQNWDYLVTFNGTFWQIRFYNIAYPGNNLFCNVTPSGVVGIYDNVTDGVGTGRTWGGGWEVRSANVPSGIGLSLKLTTTNGTSRQGVAVTPSDEAVVFDGLSTGAGPWTVLANKYQFFLMVQGAGATGGTFMYAGHLYPSRGITFFNYITGPHNKIARSDGQRDGFNGIGRFYYCSSGSGFGGVNGSDQDKNPTMTVPVYGHGVFTEKGANPLSGLPIINDLDQAQVFDAFLAAPRIAGENVHNVGWIWDALIYSNQQTMDTTGSTINGKNSYVVISQTGGDPFQSNSQGSLIVQAQP